MEQKPRKAAKGETFTSKRLKFALCDPDGRPFLIAHDPGLCLGQYVDMRGGIIVDNETERRYFEVLKRRKWTIRHIETNVTIGSRIMDLKEFRSLQRDADKEAKKVQRRRT